MPLKSRLKGCHRCLGRARLPISLCLRDGFDRQARTRREFGLRQAEDCPSGTQLCGKDGFAVGA